MKNKIRTSALSVLAIGALIVGGALPAEAHKRGTGWTAWEGLYRIQYGVGNFVGDVPGACDIHTVHRRILFAPPWDWRSTLPSKNMTIC